MLGIDVGADASVALRLGDDVRGERGLTRGLRAEDLGDTATGQTADAEGEIERERTGGDRLDRHASLLAHLHDRALAELLLDLAEGYVECLVAVCFHCSLLSSRIGPL